MSARLSIEATVVGENRGFAQCTTLCFILLPKHFIMLSNSLKEWKLIVATMAKYDSFGRNSTLQGLSH